MNDQGIDRNKLHEVYLEKKSYVQTATYFGVSKQRIQQILKRCDDPRVVAVRNTKRQKNFTPLCLICNRVFGEEVRYHGRGLCSPCASTKRKGTILRSSMYPRLCLSCGKSIVAEKRRSKGRCVSCYRKYFTHQSLAFKASVQRYRESHREQINAKSRAYYYAHREQLIAYGRKYNAEHRERLNAYSREYQKRRYWERKKQLASEV